MASTISVVLSHQQTPIHRPSSTSRTQPAFLVVSKGIQTDSVLYSFAMPFQNIQNFHIINDVLLSFHYN